MNSIHKIALVCLAPPNEIDNMDENVLESWPGYGVRRIWADVLAAGWADQVEIVTLEYAADDYESLLAELEGFSPDLLGCSVYMWSFGPLVEVARQYKQFRPDGLVLFGGPSSRTCMMELPPYRDAGRYVDALCLGEGEGVVNDILNAGATTRDDLMRVPGLAIAKDAAWVESAPRDLIMDLDTIASPYEMGLMPEGQWGYLETYRGCPMSCSFCQWGVSGPNNRVFSRDYIAREMEAMLANNVFPGIFHLDAGLNLNAKGFREFAAAAEATSFFKQKFLFCHVYPSSIKQEHLDFLASCAHPVIGLGLQTFDQQVLKSHARPAKIDRFAQVVHQLAEIGTVEIQLLMGLPGDTPESFMRALDYSLSLPGPVRVSHTLVLPDALMTRASPEFDIKFDPVSLKIESCQGWSAEDIERTAKELHDMADGGTDLWWSLNSQRTQSVSA